MSALFTQLQDWLNQPFKTSNNAYEWFAFIGLILVSLFLWHQIARDFSHTVSEID